jgi:PAS domain-containing protein
VTGLAGGNSPAKSLPLILARELAANLATPMFLLDASGMLVFYNDAAALIIGKPFGELDTLTGVEFGHVLELTDLDGEPVRGRNTPSGTAYFERRPAHKTVVATALDGVRRTVHATAYPLFGTTDEFDGVVTVFWPAEGP